MKKLIVLLGILLGIGILTQCNENTDTVTSDSDEIVSRALNSDCNYNTDNCNEQHIDTVYITPVLPGSINGVPIPAGLIKPGCQLGGIFTYWKCPGDEFLFTDYQFFIPPGCPALRDFMDGLSYDDYAIVFNFLSSYVENQGMLVIIQSYADDGIITATAKTDIYKPYCYKECRRCELDFDTDGPGPEFPLVQNKSIDNHKSDESIELRGGKGGKPCEHGTWVFSTTRCGKGCCVTTIIYEKNRYGVMVKVSEETSADGSCEGPGDSCPLGSEIVVDCAYHCN